MSYLGILGCGWLGIPLAKYLSGLGFQIRGSRTSKKGVFELEKKNIKGYKVILNDKRVNGIVPFIDELETLIISIPPKKKSNEKLYLEQIKILLEYIISSSIKRVLFLSSISVYGYENKTYNEKTKPLPKTFSAKALYESEKLLLQINISTTIIRLGGLIGKDRNPIYKLEGKKIKNPKGRINFIHQFDAIRGIASLVCNVKLQGVFNLVTPHHPIREEYYRHIADKFHLSNPKFQKDTEYVRVIEANKITDVTSFNYTIDNLLI